MITFSIIIFLLAIAGVILGIFGLGAAILFGDAAIGIGLLVLIIRKLFFNKNKDKQEK